MIYHRKLKLIILCLLVLQTAAWLDPYRDRVDRGNSLFHEKKYAEAGKEYREAENYAPGESDKKKLAFNKGNADYMSGDMESALANYKKALQSDDPDVQKKAFLNMGNTYLKMGNNREAVDAYINALKIDPRYEKAKKNIEYMLKKKEKDKQDKQDKKSGDGNDQKNKNDKNEKDQDKKNQDKNQDKKNDSQKAGQRMNKEQIRNMLESMQKKPVQRQKGSNDDQRHLEKNW
ncbi:MAG: hypothetical protein CVV44_06155 [Spirochaetae bacterium HGW-Spirochaetae-1]|jgi:tetratricopeptide (TPR) repeat protein|nr:MAG: hypothetical protein CVV44_06155 [Spirochaetae bacterium HGW-Spirochaetae-1]